MGFTDKATEMTMLIIFEIFFPRGRYRRKMYAKGRALLGYWKAEFDKEYAKGYKGADLDRMARILHHRCRLIKKWVAYR